MLNKSVFYFVPWLRRLSAKKAKHTISFISCLVRRPLEAISMKRKARLSTILVYQFCHERVVASSRLTGIDTFQGRQLCQDCFTCLLKMGFEI